MNKNTIIFDLDGTLADINERKQKAQWKSNDKAMDWDIFFDPENIKLDKPKPEVIKCAQMFHQQGYKIVIFSGRNDRSFHSTKEWLAQHEILMTYWYVDQTSLKMRVGQ